MCHKPWFLLCCKHIQNLPSIQSCYILCIQYYIVAVNIYAYLNANLHFTCMCSDMHIVYTGVFTRMRSNTHVFPHACIPTRMHSCTHTVNTKLHTDAMVLHSMRSIPHSCSDYVHYCHHFCLFQSNCHCC